MQKRTLVIIFLSIILIGMIGGAFYYAYKSGFFEKNNTEEEKTLTFFLKPIDQYNQNLIELDYSVFSGQTIEECLTSYSFNIYQKNKSKIYEMYPYLEEKTIDENGCYIKKVIFTKETEGKLTKSLNEIKLNQDKIYTIYFKSDQYYTNSHLFLPLSVTREESKQYSDMDSEIFLLKDISNNSIHLLQAVKKAEKVNISLWGDVKQNEKNNVRLAVKGDNQLNNLEVCFTWTMGIVDVRSSLEETYRPIRFPFADKCFDLQKSLLSNNGYFITQDFEVITKDFVEEELEIVIIDKDYYYDGNNWKLDIEDMNGKDIGAKDSIEKLKFI